MLIGVLLGLELLAALVVSSDLMRLDGLRGSGGAVAGIQAVLEGYGGAVVIGTRNYGTTDVSQYQTSV